MSTNEEAGKLNADTQLIVDFIRHTNQPVFLTGKAGTGKTTLLRYIKNNISKNLAIVAPTAVAALNAGGVTMHSFFQIPFGPLIPSAGSATSEAGEEQPRINYAPDKIKLLKCLELLIIDEISMVRADTLDYVDFVLKTINASNQAFGGIQVLMIGDLYQLPPVTNQDWPLLNRYYTSPYFFDSRVFKAVNLLTFELTKVYRQSDPVFINILNGIRNDNLDEALLARLNECYKDGVAEAGKEEYVTLTTHNQLVSSINNQRLESLDAPLHTFHATITGDFPKDAYPADAELQLKEGAQVMFTKNDSSGKKLYYNGRTAKVKSINGATILLEFLDDASEFELIQEQWRNIKYGLNETDQQITETNAGSFAQYPIKLAWAITIHKSQGLTFDKAIIDISAAFAHGQAYVALSRCRSLEGLLLNAPVQQRNIITDPQVIRFMQGAANDKPDKQLLQKCMHWYERSLIEGLMDFGAIIKYWSQIGVLVGRYDTHLNNLKDLYEQTDALVLKEIAAVAVKFIRQEVVTLSDEQLLTAQPAFLGRLQKAASYFIPKVDQFIKVIHKMIAAPWNVNSPEGRLLDVLNNCLNVMMTKHALLELIMHAFTTEEFLATKRKASSRYKEARKMKPGEKPEKALVHPQLYQDLLNWRNAYSDEKNVANHSLIADKTLKLIAEKSPRNINELAAIKGIGPVKAGMIGDQVVRVISNYFGAQQLF